VCPSFGVHLGGLSFGDDEPEKEKKRKEEERRKERMSELVPEGAYVEYGYVGNLAGTKKDNRIGRIQCP